MGIPLKLYRGSIKKSKQTAQGRSQEHPSIVWADFTKKQEILKETLWISKGFLRFFFKLCSISFSLPMDSLRFPLWILFDLEGNSLKFPKGTINILFKFVAILKGTPFKISRCTIIISLGIIMNLEGIPFNFPRVSSNFSSNSLVFEKIWSSFEWIPYDFHSNCVQFPQIANGFPKTSSLNSYRFRRESLYIFDGDHQHSLRFLRKRELLL